MTRLPFAIDAPLARLRAKDWLSEGQALPVVLDLARGLAALAVLVFHLRTWLFVAYPDLQGRGLTASAFYAATTFGHDAVIIFFVLSGFLIGGAVLRIDLAAPAPFRSYIAGRAGRIAPVLVGAVVLAVAAQTVIVTLDPATTCHDPVLRVAGNLAALANLGVAPLCNDLPLWSLSNEVVYYVAFPVLVAALWGYRSRMLAAAAAALLPLAFASLAFTPFDDQNVVLYFTIWLVGALLWLLPQRRIPVWLGLLAFAAALMVAHTEAAKAVFFARDLFTAVSFALLLAGTTGRRWPSTGFRGRLAAGVRAVATATASISFSLYVVHSPIIDLYRAWAVRRSVTLPFTRLDAAAWGTTVGLALTAIAVAILFSLLFESQHKAIAAILLRSWRVSPARPRPAGPASTDGPVPRRMPVRSLQR